MMTYYRTVMMTVCKHTHTRARTHARAHTPLRNPRYQCGSTYTCLSRSVPDIHQHVAGTLSNQQTTSRPVSGIKRARHASSNLSKFTAERYSHHMAYMLHERSARCVARDLHRIGFVHLSVRVADNSRCSEEIVKISTCAFQRTASLA